MSDLKTLLKEFDKQYGSSVATIGVHDDNPHRIKTNVFAFDLATGGGFPVGRCSVVYGPEASAKTSLSLLAIAEAQRQYPDKRAVFVDAEGHFSKLWASQLGVDCDELVYVLPDSAEQVVDVVESLLYASDVSVVVVDSLAALVTVHELNSEAEKAMVGTSGILINKLYRKVGRALTVARRESHTPTLILINQIRSKVGVMYGNPETMPGGPSFKFASSLTIRVYGKDEMDKSVNKTMPAYKLIKFIIKKWKVPITAPNGEFLLALQPIAKYNLSIGQAYDWNTVLAYLKSMGLLVKGEGSGAKWDLIDPGTGEILSFDKQEQIKDRMYEDPKFSDMVKGWIVSLALEQDGSDSDDNG